MTKDEIEKFVPPYSLLDLQKSSIDADIVGYAKAVAKLWQAAAIDLECKFFDRQTYAMKALVFSVGGKK